MAPIIENSRRSLKKQWTKPLPRHEKPFDKCFCQVRRPSIEYGKWLSAPLLLSSVLLLLRDPTTWRIQVDANVNGRLRATNRGLRRAFSQTASTLPNKGQVATALNQLPYDAPRGAPPRRASATAWRGGDRRISHQGFTTSPTYGLVATCSPPPRRTTPSSISTIATSTESGQLGRSATAPPMCQTRPHSPHSAATALATQ